MKQDVTESNQDNGEAVMAKDQQKKCKNEKITRHETSEANHDLKQDVTESNQEKEAVKANDRNSTKLEGPAKKKRKRSQQLSKDVTPDIFTPPVGMDSKR